MVKFSLGSRGTESDVKENKIGPEIQGKDTEITQLRTELRVGINSATYIKKHRTSLTLTC